MLFLPRTESGAPSAGNMNRPSPGHSDRGNRSETVAHSSLPGTVGLAEIHQYAEIVDTDHVQAIPVVAADSTYTELRSQYENIGNVPRRPTQSPVYQQLQL